MQSPVNSTGSSSGKNFILTAVLGNYQGKQYSLKPNRETVIGRGEESDIVFDDNTVSRRHLKLLVVGDDVLLEDLGSTNGTFVAGIKITRTKAKPGDLIVIGSNMVNIGLQPAGPAIRPVEPGAEPAGPTIRVVTPDVNSGPVVRVATAGPMAPVAVKVNGYASMSGQIEQIPLADLIQLLSTSRKSGVLEVKREDEIGRCYVKDGQIEYAAIDDCPQMSPKKAFCRIMLWKDGTFELHPPSNASFDGKITESADILLLEAMRHDDEHGRLPAEKPDRHAVLSVSLDKPLHTLAPNHLNIVQLILTYGKVRKILYHSPLPDYETYRILIELIKDGFAKEEPVARIQSGPVLRVVG